MPPKRRAAKAPRKTTTPKSKPKTQSKSPLPAPETPTPTTETPISSSSVAAETLTPIPTPEPPLKTSSPSRCAAAAEKPSAPAPPDASNFAPSDGAAAAEKAETSKAPASAPAEAPKTRKVRKIIKKVIIKRIVPKGTLAARKAAEEAAAKAGSSQPTVETPAEAVKTVQEKEKKAQESAKTMQEATAEKPVHGKEVPSQKEEATETANKMEEGEGDKAAVGCEEVELSERQKRRKTEIFIGGLDRDAKEEDVRRAFARAGEIVEVRMMIDGQTGKNKGYCFLRYKEPAQAKKAVAELAKVEIRGKICGAAALEGNDTIFLGNIDKKWKKEDIIKQLQEIGVENIDTVTLMADPNNPGCNRGFAFLELETNRDAQLAYKKLTKKDVFGKGLNVKVAWAEPLNDPDEEEMQKVKSIFVEGIPNSWDQAKLTETFKKYGKIERVVLSRDIQSAKRKDFAFVNYTTREAAVLCLESFDKEELTENGSKVNIKVSLAKPVQKGKQNKGGRNFSGNEKDKPKIVQRETKVGPSSGRVMLSRVDQTMSMRDKKSTMTHELLHVLREQAAWKQGPVGYHADPAIQDYANAFSGGKRAHSARGDDSSCSDMRGYPRPRYESSTYPGATSSYSALPHSTDGSSRPYYQSQGIRYPSGSYYGMAEPSNITQTRQAGPRQAGPSASAYGSRQYPRY